MKPLSIPGLVIIALLITNLLFPVTALAQLSMEQQAKLKKDTAFQRFRLGMSDIMKTAKGKNTNYAAVKKYFLANRVAIEKLQKTYKLSDPPKTRFISVKDRPVAGIQKTAEITNLVLVYNSFDYTRSLQDDTEWDIAESGGKETWSKYYEPGAYHDLGWASFNYEKLIPVPNDPLVVGARIEFKYEFMATGWDMGGGQFSTFLGFYADDKFHSTGYNNLGTSTVKTLSRQNTYKRASAFTIQTFMGDREYTYTKDSSFVIEGHVAPGQDFYIEVGACYDDMSPTGGNGAYHYGEFRLKQIIVHFLKAGQ